MELEPGTVGEAADTSSAEPEPGTSLSECGSTAEAVCVRHSVVAVQQGNHRVRKNQSVQMPQKIAENFLIFYFNK